MVTIRLADHTDLPSMQHIELSAAALFRTLGMDAVADDDPPSLAHLAAYQRAGRAWVAVDSGGRTVGFLLLQVLTDSAHVEQVSVDPPYARRRIGEQLISAAEVWAGEHGLTSLTLTSYAQVPWNAPYYARLGFVVLAEQEQPAEIEAIRRAERARGLDAWPRVAMRRPTRTNQSADRSFQGQVRPRPQSHSARELLVLDGSSVSAAAPVPLPQRPLPKESTQSVLDDLREDR